MMNAEQEKITPQRLKLIVERFKSVIEKFVAENVEQGNIDKEKKLKAVMDKFVAEEKIGPEELEVMLDNFMEEAAGLANVDKENIKARIESFEEIKKSNAETVKLKKDLEMIEKSKAKEQERVDERNRVYEERVAHWQEMKRAKKLTTGEELQLDILIRLEEMLMDNFHSKIQANQNFVMENVLARRLQFRTARILEDVEKRLKNSESLQLETTKILKEVVENTSTKRQFWLIVGASFLSGVVASFLSGLFLFMFQQWWKSG